LKSGDEISDENCENAGFIRPWGEEIGCEHPKFGKNSEKVQVTKSGIYPEKRLAEITSKTRPRHRGKQLHREGKRNYFNRKGSREFRSDSSRNGKSVRYLASKCGHGILK